MCHLGRRFGLHVQESHRLSLYSGSRIFRIVSTSNLEISGVGYARVRPGCDGMIRASMGHHAQPVALSLSCEWALAATVPCCGEKR